jgi:hypothetical protein
MALRLTDAGVLAMALLVATIILVYMRPKIPSDSNWPLLYFIGLVVYQKMYEDLMNPYPIFIGVLCAGMIRFEFMNTRFVKYCRWLELLMLTYVIWSLLGFVLYF